MGTKEEKVQAILTGNAGQFYYDQNPAAIGLEALRKYYEEISVKDLREYSKKKGVGYWADPFEPEPGLHDGCYCHEESDGWLAYYQERGIKFTDDKVYPTRDAAIWAYMLLRYASGLIPVAEEDSHY